MEELRTRSVHGEIEEIVDEIEIKFKKFKKFTDVPWDHSLSTSKFDGLKKQIEKEWENLKKSLSNYSIFVRTYDSKPDLMKAVVIGPPNTPYDNGLFFFDIYLPLNYPASPPKIHHRSSMQESSSQHDRGVPDFKHLIRYMDGKTHSISDALFAIHKSFFSLSFTNNTKRAQSMHNREVDKCRTGCFPAPRSSVLANVDPTTSLHCYDIDHMQHNILEPRYKSALLYTCKKMIADLRSPPADFRDFVLGHFRKRSHEILCMVQANMSKAKENMLKDQANMSKVKEIMEYSNAMLVLFEHLYRAFDANGSYVEHFSGFLNAKSLEIRLEKARLGNDEEDNDNGFMSRLKKNFVDCVHRRIDIND